VKIEGVKIKVDFEVIEIMDEFDRYPTLLGIDWAFKNNDTLSFETDTLCMVVSLDPYEGDHYNEPVHEDVRSLGIENIYKVTGHREYYINPMHIVN